MAWGIGYNIQKAVEGNSDLIVHHEVADEGTDNCLLGPIAKAAKAELQSEKLVVLAARVTPIMNS